MVIYNKAVFYDLNSPRNLEAAYLYYCGKRIQDAHSADSDVLTCAKVLEGQLEMYGELPSDVGGLCAICSVGRENYIDKTGKFIWIDNEAFFNFGKHGGVSVRDIANEYSDYLEWMLRDDFPPEVIDMVSNTLKGNYPER